MADLEHQGISGDHSTEQYGAVDTTSKKGPNEASKKLPLFLGRWEVSPDRLYRIGLTCYIGWFVVHRVLDIFYILTVDARFPEGLGHLYPSEAERLASVSYTKQVLLCGMCNRILVFCVVVSFIFFRLFARLDAALRAVPTWLAASTAFGRPYAWCGQFKDHVLGGRLATDLSNTYLGRLKDHMLRGRLATEICDRFGFPLSICELLLGSVYLALMGACFFALSGPFMYWNQSINLKFGFTNSLNVSLANFKMNFIAATVSMLIMAVPKKFMFLVVLQYRLGWVFMWAGLIMSSIYSQYNVKMIAPMLGLNAIFPTDTFAVGRGFPLVETPVKWAPWISLNRIYLPSQFSTSLEDEPTSFYTNDKSKGNIALAHRPSGKWTLSGTAWFDPSAKAYAETTKSRDKESNKSIALSDQPWSIGGEQTRVGMRSGKKLREKLFGFAGERGIGIEQVYMVDGSHQDARANAFVAGAGNSSVIGLYDTLFLGKRGSDASDEDEEDDPTESKSLIQHRSEVVQGVDIEAESQYRKAPRNSAPTQAMNDDEIVAILAHELAHSALKHMEMGMGTQIVTSFMTFATLGWMAHSPLAASALSLTVPILHVGSCAYDHVVGPPLAGFMKLFTDGLTRHNEYEADAYAARISERYGTGLQSALAKLSVNSNQDPDPPYFYEALHADHPTFARRWANIEKVKKETYGDGKKP